MSSQGSVHPHRLRECGNLDVLIDRVGQQLVTGTKTDRCHTRGGEVTTIGREFPDSDWSLLTQDLVDDAAGGNDGGMIFGQDVGRIASGYGPIETCIGTSIEYWNRDAGLGTLPNRSIGKLLQYSPGLLPALIRNVPPVAGQPDLAGNHDGATLIGPQKSGGDR